MKKNKILSLGLVMAVSVSILTGCNVKTDTPILGMIMGLKENQVFEINDIVCTDSEVKLILMNTANEYKVDFGENVSWKQEIGDTTLEEYIKEKAKNDISVTYTMSALADDKNMNLSDNERIIVKAAADKYYDAMTTEEKNYTGATKNTVETVFTNYYKVNKVYNSYTDSIDSEISDEEARVIKVQYIFIDTTKTDAAKAKSTLEDVRGLVNGGYQTFSREARQYSDRDETELILKKNEAEKDYEKAAFNLANGKMSPIITQSDGLYLVYCESSYLKKETALNKSKIIQADKRAYFQKVYENFTDNADIDFNTKAWKKIELPSGEGMKSTGLKEAVNTIKK